MKVFFENVGSCIFGQLDAFCNMRNAPLCYLLPTKNCHSGPVGVSIVLFVSIKGTIPVIPLMVWWPDMGYRGGGGKTLDPSTIARWRMRLHRIVSG